MRQVFSRRRFRVLRERWDLLRTTPCEPFRDRLRGDAPGYADRVRDLQQRIRATGAAALYDEVRTADVANVANTIAADRYDVFQRAVDVIAASRRVYVLGLRGAYSVAFFFTTRIGSFATIRNCSICAAVFSTNDCAVWMARTACSSFLCRRIRRSPRT